MTSIDQLGRLGKLQGVQWEGKHGLDVSHLKPLKALYNDGCKCTRTVVIEAGYWGLLWHRNDDGGLEPHWNNGSAQGDENVSENIYQLVCTFSLPGILSGCPPRVNFAKSLPHISHSQTQHRAVFLTIVVFSSAHLVGKYHYHRHVLMSCSRWWPGCPMLLVSLLSQRWLWILWSHSHFAALTARDSLALTVRRAALSPALKVVSLALIWLLSWCRNVATINAPLSLLKTKQNVWAVSTLSRQRLRFCKNRHCLCLRHKAVSIYWKS